MADPWTDLADTFVSTVKDRAKGFLANNAKAKAFLVDRGKRLGKLAWQLKTASDGGAREKAERGMKKVQQSIENELATLSLNGSDESKSVFRDILNTAVAVFVKMAPALLARIG